MSETKKSKDTVVRHTDQYFTIKKEIEAWPAWKVSVYNSHMATSVHAEKLKSKTN